MKRKYTDSAIKRLWRSFLKELLTPIHFFYTGNPGLSILIFIILFLVSIFLPQLLPKILPPVIVCMLIGLVFAYSIETILGYIMYSDRIRNYDKEISKR